jgi:carboxyl-terminal processing protease
MEIIKRYRGLVFLILFFALGFGAGQVFRTDEIKEKIIAPSPIVINNSTTSANSNIDMAPFWKVWDILNEKYVPTGKSTTTVSDQDKIWGAIQGLTDSFGDPYTIFMPPEEAEDFETDISGNFEGIGMEVSKKDGILSVISPLKGSPSEKAGIKTGDKIITINGEATAGLTTDKAVKLIRGPKGTVVKLGVIREGSTKPLEISVTRDVINVPSLETELKDDIYVISLYNFYADSKSQFKQALKDFIKTKKSRLIIDLRGNPGGYLDAAVDMASWFLPLGKVIVRESFGEDSDRPEKVYRSKGYNVFNEKLKLVILVDEGSASASEILAGALQENYRATLVGTKTYGKGSVQELIDVTSNTSIKVTVARWLTPSGKSISENGLMPDLVVEISDEDVKAERDPQMDKAIEILRN